MWKKFICAIMFVGFITTSFAAEEFTFDQVKLLDGPFRHAQDVNLEVLLKYDVDRLLAGFRKEAGLTAKAQSFSNWDGLDGHVGGHYLSAMAMYAAVTGNAECKRRMDYIVSELAACQTANGDGYVGAIPGSKELWKLVKAGDPKAVEKRWVPWYNLHKTFAGLRDAWIYGHNVQAKEVLIKLSDWCDNLLAGYSDEQMETMMNQEHGGMNEVLADVSVITGDKKYLKLACRFCHHQLLDSMSQGKDTLDNKHANTQVPKAIGFERIAELGGEKKYGDAARFFWETVVNNRTLAFGGNSRREHFPSAEGCKEWVTEREGPETCNTYNMLKLTEGLYRMNPQASYADFYERALYNHILSAVHPEHGGYVYFTPARPRHYRVYSPPNQAMWCCVGSGMENPGKYGQFIYSHQDNLLFVNLFIASELNWKEKNIRLRQETNFPDESKTALTVLTDKPVQFTLKVRHPAWVSAGQLSFRLGDKSWTSESKPSSYVDINRTWNNGDRLEVNLPMHITTEAMPNVSDYTAILYGPIVLAVKTGTEDLKGLIADDQRWSHIAGGELSNVDEAPVLAGPMQSIPEKIKPLTGGQGLQFTAADLIGPDPFKKLVLEPFYKIHDSRYMMYWHVASEKEQAASHSKEQEKLLLDKRTIDRVIPGEQQPEADHNIKSETSETGNFKDASYRHTLTGGRFSYDLRVEQGIPLELMVRYWGNEAGNRTFDILIDGKKIVTENVTGKWNQEKFIDIFYPLPTETIKDKKSITVRFQANPDNIAGGVYDIRILRVINK